MSQCQVTAITWDCPLFPTLLSPSLLGPSYCLPGSPSELAAYISRRALLRYASLLRISLSNIHCNFTLNFKSTSYSKSRLHLNLWQSRHRNHSLLFFFLKQHPFNCPITMTLVSCIIYSHQYSINTWL